MNEKENLEKDELLSGYIDGQLTPRQMTELKRLLAHDPDCQRQLDAMERQRQLLQSLPVEPAPAGLSQDILSTLERRFILGSSARHADKSQKWGARLRKLLATAAMILIPMLALGAVVLTILQPAKPTLISSEPVATAETSSLSADTPLAPQLLFSAVLQFETTQPIAANDFIEKKIHSLGLMNFTATQRQSDRTSYKVVCSRKYVEGLIGELNELWPRCQKASYALLDTNTQQPVQVDPIDPQQTLAMIRLNDSISAARMAHGITEQNAQRMLAKSAENAPVQPAAEKPAKPILAQPENAPTLAEDTQDTICLVIEVLAP